MHDDPPPVNDEDPPVDPVQDALRSRLHDLDAAIHALGLTPRPDQLQIARLKKQKLLLRDIIVRIEDSLTPDIIA